MDLELGLVVFKGGGYSFMAKWIGLTLREHGMFFGVGCYCN